MIGYVALWLYALTIPAANWMIGNVGQCVPSGPCLIPIGFGLLAPSGVLMIGAALVLRDAVHSLLGWRWAIASIVFGSVLSFGVSPPELVVASVTAFALSEFLDFSVYAPLRRRNLFLAVLASGFVGSVVDSVVFLWIAFGSFDFIAGQVLGKFWMTIFAACALVFIGCKSRPQTEKD